MPEISLIIPLYNGEKYLKDCLDSVLGQTFKDFECLLIDDGSTDNTPAIIADIAKNDPRFRIITQTNAGVSAARNKGMSEAKAAYLMFLDQDDLFHPQAMETLYKIATEQGVDVAAFDFQTIADGFILNNPPLHDIENLDIKISHNPFETFFKTKKGSNVMMWVRIYKKEAIKGIEFPIGVQPAEDSVFSLKVFYRIKSYAKVELPLLFYRDSSSSVMNQGRTSKYLLSHLRAGEILYDYFLGEKRVEGEMRKTIDYYIARFFYKTCLSQILRQVPDPRLQKEMLAIAQTKLKELYLSGKFDIAKLDFKKRSAAKAFISGRFYLARILV